MGNSEKPRTTEGPLQQLLQNYTIVQQVPSQDIIYLTHNETTSQHLLKLYSTTNRSAFNSYHASILQKKILYSRCQYLTKIMTYFEKQQQSIIAQTFNLYVLFQFPHRTLDDQLNQRYINKTYFQEKELWSVLSSCIVGLSYLEKNQIQHGCLRSSTILISRDKVLKIVDPFITKYQLNSDLILNDCFECHAYISPQILDNFKNQQYYCGKIDTYKSDVWILAVIIIELALLQYQDNCFNFKNWEINWDRFQKNLQRLQKMYSIQLSNVLKIMLERELQNRPNWLQLAQHIVNVNQYGIQNQIITPKNSKGRRFRQIFEKKKQKNQLVNRLNLKQIPATTNNQRQHTLQKNNPFSQIGLKNQNQNKISHVINKKQQINKNNKFTFSYIQAEQFQFQPVQISDINTFRPIHNIYPISNYQQKTQIDLNTISEPDLIYQLPANQYTQMLRMKNNEKKIRRENNLFISLNSKMKQQGQNGVNLSRINQNRQQEPIQSSVLNIPFVNPFNSVGDDRDRTLFTNSISTNRTYYDGIIINGLRNGFGKLYFEDGGFYQGEWKQNNMHGYGKIFYNSGKIAYQGNFQNNQFQGYGTLYNESVQPYDKQFNYRDFDQIGKKWIKYEGDFIKDKKSGHGMLVLSNGETYKGQFLHDLINGWGFYKCFNGKIIQGKWLKNKLCS